MKKKRIATMGLVLAMTVLTLGSSMSVFAAEPPSGPTDEPPYEPTGSPKPISSGTTGVFIQDAGYVDPTHPGYDPGAYEFEVPTQLLYAMKHNGKLVGGWIQKDNDGWEKQGEIKNQNQLPIQVTNVKFEKNSSDWNFTNPAGENYVHFTINAKGVDIPDEGIWSMDSVALLKGVDTSGDDNFHMLYEGIPGGYDTVTLTDDGTGVAYKVTNDIRKQASQLGTIRWTVNGDSVDVRTN